MRGRLDPKEVGLPVVDRRRRVPGLRIEEAAVLADVGLTWYSALESGKDIRPSTKLLHRVARALRLNDVERDHLFALALPHKELTVEASAPHLQAIVGGFTVGPAFICDRFWNVGDCNFLARAVYGHDVAREKNLLVRIMLEPAFQALHEDWQSVARQMVGILQLAYGKATGDERATSLVERLHAASPQFTQWWNDYRVRDYEPARATIVHPTLGRLEFLYTSFIATSLTRRQSDIMVLLQPPLDEPTRERLAALAAGDPRAPERESVGEQAASFAGRRRPDAR